MQKMTAVNTIFVKKGMGPMIIERFKQPKAVHTFEGFIRMEVLLKNDSEEHDEVKVCTTWEDKQYFENWLNSRESKKSHDKKGYEANEESPILGNELTTFNVYVQHLPLTTEAK